MADKPKILLLDIETFPNVAYVWGMYEQNVIRLKEERCVAAFAAKWLHGPMVAKCIADYPGYKAESYDDKKLVKDLWKLFDEADIIVAHNGRAYDVKFCKARFIYHGLKPPSPFRTVDTLNVVRKIAKFNSNKLDDLARYMQIGKKMNTGGFSLWEDCINGDKDAWEKMLQYNKHDVRLLEQLYIKLLPWIDSHPNMTVFTDRAKCAKCGSANVFYRGVTVAQTGKYRKFQCQDCGGWGQETKSLGRAAYKNAKTD
jgi:DNA polymerase elongation subunit (family B)